MILRAPVNAKSSKLGIVVYRSATNTYENLGMVSFYHRNFFINYLGNKWIAFKVWRRNRKDGSQGTE